MPVQQMWIGLKGIHEGGSKITGRYTVSMAYDIHPVIIGPMCRHAITNVGRIIELLRYSHKTSILKIHTFSLKKRIYNP
jgi:hypothetical protein